MAILYMAVNPPSCITKAHLDDFLLGLFWESFLGEDWDSFSYITRYYSENP